MLDILLSFDILMFRFLNEGISNPFLDFLMPFITIFRHFVIPIILLGIFLIWKEKRRGLEIVIMVALIVLITDQVSSHIIKPLVTRIRPCHAFADVRTLLWCNSSYSFTSSHAANTMGAALVLCTYFRKAWAILLLMFCAFMVGLSRIYIGVHYPFDVFGGQVLALFSVLFLFKLRKCFFYLLPFLKGKFS